MAGQEAEGWVLAVDFGTSFTTAAIGPVDGGGSAVVLEVERSRYLPSLVYRDEAGQLLTGRAARAAVVFPERAERVPKRALVAGDRVLLGGVAVESVELVAAVLGRVYGEALQQHGGRPPARVVLTHPARWGEDQVLLGRLCDAAGRAGIADPVLMAEPVAAAWWYARPSRGESVAVFDLGGGTLDTAVLRASATGFEIAGPPGGDAHLGGEDFDELLLERVGELAADRDEQLWEQLSGANGPRAARDRARLRDDVTAAKEALSEHLTHDLVVGDYAEAFRLTRGELDELIAAKIDTAAQEMRRTITAANLTPDQLVGVFLTGGSSRIPLIAARLAVALGIQPHLRDDPKAVVALGALAALAGRAALGAAADAAALLQTAEQALADGRHADAKAAYERAADSGDANVTPEANRQLGKQLRNERDYAGARLAYQRAIDSGHPDAAPAAAAELAELLNEQGDVAGARALYQLAIDSGHPDHAPVAMVNLGLLLHAQGDRAGARALYQRAIDSSHPDGLMAMLAFGQLLEEQGDVAGAHALYQRAIDSNHAVVARWAANALADLLREHGDDAGARAVFKQAIDSGASWAAPEAEVGWSQFPRFQHNAHVWGVALSPDGERVATACTDKTARVWEIASGRELARITHNKEVRRIAFSPDGTRIATASWDRTARVWEIARGRELARLAHSRAVSGVAFTHDGTRIATAGNDGTARVWELASGRELALVTHNQAIWGVCFGPDGTRIATASLDGTARVWELATGRQVARFNHLATVAGVAFSSDGTRIATASADHTARVWDVASERELTRLVHEHAVYDVAFSADAISIATASSAGDSTKGWATVWW